MGSRGHPNLDQVELGSEGHRATEGTETDPSTEGPQLLR